MKQIINRHRYLYLCGLFLLLFFEARAQQKTVWQIGMPDGRADEFALYPLGYKNFVASFGGENTVYNIGYSKASTHWPFTMPGPLNNWGGGGYWAGFAPRHFPRIYFRLPAVSTQVPFRFTIGFADADSQNPPLFEVDINGHVLTQPLKAGSGRMLRNPSAGGMPQTTSFEIPASWMQEGMNSIRIGSKKGSWVVFDYLQLTSGADVPVQPGYGTLITAADAAPFEYRQGSRRIQPLLVDLYQPDTSQWLAVRVEGMPVIKRRVEKGHSILEIPMPAVTARKPRQRVTISAGTQDIYKGLIDRAPQPLHAYTGYVDLLMGTGNSRWMFKPGPALPLSMVHIAPDNQDQTWKAGYEYTVDNIMGFSHFTDWTICGLLTMPTGGPLQVNPGTEDRPDDGYRARIDKKTEKATVGKYSVFMTDTRINAEVTATRRASMQRYTFPKMDSARILVDLFTPNEYPHNLVDAKVTKRSSTEIEGYATYYNAFTGYSLEQRHTIYFVMQVSKPFASMGGWVNKGVPPVKGYIPEWNMTHAFSTEPEIFTSTDEIRGFGDAGIFLNYKTTGGEVIEVRTGVSLVDLAGARNNLQTEINAVYDWDFDAIVRNQEKVWNGYLGRVEIETDDYLQKRKFYTNLYRALSAKSIWSDADGRFTDENEQQQRLEDPADCIVSGEYWNTFWNNQQLFNLVAPEISSRWARSAIALYRNSGWFNTDPAGIEHTGVMVAMHVASQIQGAWQSGIHDFDLATAYQGLKKMLTTPPQKFEGGGTVGVENLVPYQQYGYIPQGMGAVSNTLEYAYDDYCLSQMAATLGKKEDQAFFQKRSQNWRHLLDTATRFIRPKTKEGKWVTPFDPYHTPGFVEGNAFNYTWFVPQDPASLVAAIGKKTFITRLDSAMARSSVANFNALGDDFAAYPINHGNQPSMQVAYLFNWAGAPWLTQQWVRAIQEQYYGTTPYDAYPGDEDLGQMSSWFVMSAIGFFQMDGGCAQQPVYEIGSPRYPRITVHLDGRYNRGKQLVIEAPGASKENKYIQEASFNGKPLKDFRLLQQDVLKGGRLELKMGPAPNRKALL
ncbi:MAG: GH92 family glycosyl hydrolase [Niabella sp.]|nr:GH92 family glycosyl hydrolase [Niabella sp.]